MNPPDQPNTLDVTTHSSRARTVFDYPNVNLV
jgi:hypothetical protein